MENDEFALLPVLPLRIGIQCLVCKEVKRPDKFERYRWRPERARQHEASPKRLGVMLKVEGRVCTTCTPLSPTEELNFAKMTTKARTLAVQRGVIPPSRSKWEEERAAAVRAHEHAQRIAANKEVKWGRPWWIGVFKLEREKVWLKRRRVYMSARGGYKGAQRAARGKDGSVRGLAKGSRELSTFFDLYQRQLQQVLDLFRDNARLPQELKLVNRIKRGTSAQGHRALVESSTWADYMFDGARRMLNEAYWALMHLDGEALGRHGTPLLLLTTENPAAPLWVPGPAPKGVKARREDALARAEQEQAEAFVAKNTPGAPPVVLKATPRKTVCNVARYTLTFKRASELLEYVDDDSGSGQLVWRETGKPAGSPISAGYYAVHIEGSLVYRSHLVWLLCHGRWPASRLYRRNGMPDDDRVENLYEKDAGRPVSADSGAVTPVEP